MSFTKLSAGTVLVFGGLLMAANSAAANSASAAAPAKVTICHFNGHVGDFVTNNSIGNPAGQPLCDSEGGNAIHVAPSACKNGHQAEARRETGFKNCDDGDNQPG